MNGQPVVDILVVTHGPDADWLRYCLASVAKFARGFRQTVVVYPYADASKIDPVLAGFNVARRPYHEAPPPYGHLHHNVQKCRADEICDGAEYVLHMDADCVFTEQACPTDYFVDGKPALLREPYERVGEAQKWRPIVTHAIGVDFPYETMRRHPIVHAASTYAKTRKWIEDRTAMAFEKWVLCQQPLRQFTCGFCEFNTLGAVALLANADAYHVVTLPEQAPPPARVRQFWSHGGITREVRDFMRATLDV